jgi:hypothetical protein
MKQPDAVRWFVVSVHIHSFDRVVPRRARTHVSEEVPEVVPTVAYFDAATAVVFEVRVVRVVATLHYSFPRDVFCRSPFASGSTMNSFMKAGCLAPQASARSGIAGSDVAAWKSDNFSAVAPTLEVTLTVAAIQWLDYRQPSEALTGNVYKFHRGYLSVSSE